MSAMREAFEKWWNASKYMQVVISSKGAEQCAFDGWQAAIEHIKAQGAVVRYLGNGAVVIENGKFLTVDEPIYRIPED